MFLTTFIRRFFRRPHLASPWDNGEPIREELFSVERLEDHARSLAAAQPVSSKRIRALPLTMRLANNGSVLLAVNRSLSKAVQEKRPITPAAEWLIDNYHVVERQIREIRNDLPHGYYRQLPKLADGPFVGYPRVFGVAWAFVAHTDSRFEPEMLRRFVRAYQEVQPLTIGELWAVAITLRIVLVENFGASASGSYATGPHGRRPMVSPIACWALVDVPQSRRLLCWQATKRRRLQTRLLFSLYTGCASKIHGSRQLWRGSISELHLNTRRLTRSCATNTRGKVRRASRCATSSRVCV